MAEDRAAATRALTAYVEALARAPPREPRTLGALRSDRRGPRPGPSTAAGGPT